MRRQRERLLLALDRILALTRSQQRALDLAGSTQGVRDSGGYRLILPDREGLDPSLAVPATEPTESQTKNEKKTT